MATRLRRIAGAATALLAAGTLLTACGDDSADAGSSGGSSAGGADAAIAKLVPADIRDKGYLTLAADPTYPPSTFTEGGKIVGLEPDIWAAAGKLMGLKMKPTAVAFDAIVPGLQAGRYDASFAGFWITDERVKSVDMVEFFRSGSQFVASADNKDLAINSLDDTCGLTVALQSGSYEVPYAQEQSKKCEAAGKPEVDVEIFKTQDQATLAVTTGRADATGMGTEVAGYLVKQSKGKLRLAGDVFHEVPGGMALPKGSKLDQAFVAALKKLQEDGTYDDIFAEWGLKSAEADAITLHSSAG
jgi:polar amino acid transport system substrate-binding protein